jgi:pathogenesis-related protein 1
MSRSSGLAAVAPSIAACLLQIGCGGSTAPAPSPPPPGLDETSEADRTEPAAQPDPVARGGQEPVRDASDLPANATAMLAAHNRLRALHCARPLSWSSDLTATAQEWANSLRDRGCRFEHSRTAYGENLAAGTRLTAENAVELWAREAREYDYKRPRFSAQTGHFTQMVWMATRSVGCAASECDGMRTWVCHYDPPGNVISLFSDNVAPPRCR